MEKLVEMMQLHLQKQREEMQAQEQRFRAQAEAQEQRASRKTTSGHEAHASTPCEARSIGPGLTASDHFSHSNFFSL